MEKTVLIVDDDVRIGDLEQEVLAREGFVCLRAYSGTEAVLLLEKHRPDLILLDLMLPGLSGEEVLPKLGTIPTIVVSARADIDDKVSLLTGGAVDYITKPFNTRELAARVAAALRRVTAPMPDVCVCGDITLDIASHAVTVCGRGVSLTKTEYAILKLLMQNRNRVIARSVILDRISDDTPDCTESSLKTHISHLRAKLREAGGKDCIESVWGIGFKLNET